MVRTSPLNVPGDDGGKHWQPSTSYEHLLVTPPQPTFVDPGGHGPLDVGEMQNHPNPSSHCHEHGPSRHWAVELDGLELIRLLDELDRLELLELTELDGDELMELDEPELLELLLELRELLLELLLLDELDRLELLRELPELDELELLELGDGGDQLGKLGRLGLIGPSHFTPICGSGMTVMFCHSRWMSTRCCTTVCSMELYHAAVREAGKFSGMVIHTAAATSGRQERRRFETKSGSAHFSQGEGWGWHYGPTLGSVNGPGDVFPVNAIPCCGSGTCGTVCQSLWISP